MIKLRVINNGTDWHIEYPLMQCKKDTFSTYLMRIQTMLYHKYSGLLKMSMSQLMKKSKDYEFILHFLFNFAYVYMCMLTCVGEHMCGSICVQRPKFILSIFLYCSPLYYEEGILAFPGDNLTNSG